MRLASTGSAHRQTAGAGDAAGGNFAATDDFPNDWGADWGSPTMRRQHGVARLAPANPPPDKENSLLSLPSPPIYLAPVVVAVLAALAGASPAQAAPTAVERPDATALNFTLPGQELALNFARKAG